MLGPDNRIYNGMVRRRTVVMVMPSLADLGQNPGRSRLKDQGLVNVGNYGQCG